MVGILIDFTDLIMSFLRIGRSGEIRTHDPLHPMQVRYQAALRPESITLKSLECHLIGF
jgi:hypothetical protein